MVFSFRYKARMRKILLTIGLALAAFPAQAVMIKNCDSLDHEVVVHHYGGAQTVVGLRPGEARKIYGVSEFLSMGDQKIDRPRYDDFYCVWKDGIKLQRRGSLRRGGGRAR
jgi:hypothetical protein